MKNKKNNQTKEEGDNNYDSNNWIWIFDELLWN